MLFLYWLFYAVLYFFIILVFESATNSEFGFFTLFILPGLISLFAIFAQAYFADKKEQNKLNVKPKKKIDNIDNIDNMTGEEFEEWCANLLLKMGFVNVKLTVKSGDQGADILAEHNGHSYTIQCKRFSKKVTNKAVQEVIASKQYYDKDFAMVMTNNYFTKSAIELAEKANVILCDRNDLYQSYNKYC